MNRGGGLCLASKVIALFIFIHCFIVQSCDNLARCFTLQYEAVQRLLCGHLLLHFAEITLIPPIKYPNFYYTHLTQLK